MIARRQQFCRSFVERVASNSSILLCKWLVFTKRIEGRTTFIFPLYLFTLSLLLVPAFLPRFLLLNIPGLLLLTNSLYLVVQVLFWIFLLFFLISSSKFLPIVSACSDQSDIYKPNSSNESSTCKSSNKTRPPSLAPITESRGSAHISHTIALPQHHHTISKLFIYQTL